MIQKTIQFCFIKRPPDPERVEISDRSPQIPSLPFKVKRDLLTLCLGRMFQQYNVLTMLTWI